MNFDLKGSFIERFVQLPEEDRLFWRKSEVQKKCLKDLNFIQINKDTNDGLVCLTPQQFKKITLQLMKDSMFLSYNNIMDYSLLLAIKR